MQIIRCFEPLSTCAILVSRDRVTRTRQTKATPCGGRSYPTNADTWACARWAYISLLLFVYQALGLCIDPGRQ